MTKNRSDNVTGTALSNTELYEKYKEPLGKWSDRLGIKLEDLAKDVSSPWFQMFIGIAINKDPAFGKAKKSGRKSNPSQDYETYLDLLVDEFIYDLTDPDAGRCQERSIKEGIRDLEVQLKHQNPEITFDIIRARRNRVLSSLKRFYAQISFSEDELEEDFDTTGWVAEVFKDVDFEAVNACTKRRKEKGCKKDST